jgi:hypothetical protein
MVITANKGITIFIDGVEVEDINSTITPERRAEINKRLDATIESRLKRPENTHLFYAKDNNS